MPRCPPSPVPRAGQTERPGLVGGVLARSFGLPAPLLVAGVVFRS
jgi:hypothetical protein